MTTHKPEKHSIEIVVSNHTTQSLAEGEVDRIEADVCPTCDVGLENCDLLIAFKRQVLLNIAGDRAQDAACVDE